jgi:hypothetical protein
MTTLFPSNSHAELCKTTTNAEKKLAQQKLLENTLKKA